MKSTVTAFRHVALVVRDLDKMRDFYARFLGFKEMETRRETGSFIETVTGLRGVALEWSKLRGTDGIVLELLRYDCPKSEPHSGELQAAHRTGWSHIAVQTDDVDALHAEWNAVGVRFKNAPAVSPNGYARVAYAHDPEGNIVEVVQVLS